LLLFGIAESAQRWKFAVSDLNGKLSTIRKEAGVSSGSLLLGALSRTGDTALIGIGNTVCAYRRSMRGWQQAACQTHQQTVIQVAISDDGAYAATASYGTDGLRRWATSDGRLGGRLTIKPRFVAMGFVKNVAKCVTFSPPDELAVWTVGNKEPYALRNRDGVSGGIFREDGALFATWADTACSVTVWSLSTLKSVMSGHQCLLTSLAFSPDGQKLLTIAGDQTAVLWKLNQSGSDGLMDSLYTGCAVGAGDFYADGSRVVTACQDGQLETWMSDPIAVQSFLKNRSA
jgi:WD40 repeat protein